MTSDDLPRLLEGGERERVEFKTSLADSKRILETVAAMASLGGGTILVGVRNDGTVVGVGLGEGAVEQFAQRVLAGTDPKVFVRLQTEVVDGRAVLRIGVPPGDGPHLANGRAFTRSGPATVLMSRDEYERRLFDRLRDSSGYERQSVPESTLLDLDDGEIRRFVELAGPRGVAWDGDPAAADLAPDLAVSTRTIQLELVALEALGFAARLGIGKAARWTGVR